MNNLILLGKEYGMDIEVFKEKNNSTNISTLNDKVKLFQITNVDTYIIKAIKDNRCVKLVTENIKKTKELVEALNDIFLTSDNKNSNKLCSGNIKNKVKKDEDIDYILVKKDLVSLNHLKKDYPCIKSIEAEFSHVLCGNYITNLVNDCSMEDEAYFDSYGASITVEDNNLTRVLYVSFYSKEYNFKEFKNYLIKRLDTLLIKLNSTSVKTDKYKVLLTNNVVESILTTFAGSFQSKGIMLNESVFAGKLNKKIFSDKITIVEDSPNGVYNTNFDSEGVIKVKQVLVNDGVFVKEINNIEYAIKTGKDATGNADGVNNLYVKCGNKSFDELVKDLDNGIIIDEAVGFHSGVDKKTGNISVQAEGLYVKSGKIIKGLNMIILQTNIFEVFSNVIEIGNDLSKSSLSVLAPSLLLNDITITGKE